MVAFPRIIWMELYMGQGRPALPFSAGYVLARPGLVYMGLYVNGHDINFLMVFFFFFRFRMHDK